MRELTLATVVLLAVATPAFAQPNDVADPYGAKSISIGRYGTIAKKLETAYQNGDRSSEILLNLAAIRIKQNDLQGAEKLYREVLAQPNIDMDTLNGTAWSHDIARRALSVTAVAAK